MEIKSADFVKKVKKYAKNNGMDFHYDAGHGKGNHGRIFLNDKLTTVKGKNKKIQKPLLKAMCKQLGIRLEDL